MEIVIPPAPPLLEDIQSGIENLNRSDFDHETLSIALHTLCHTRGEPKTTPHLSLIIKALANHDVVCFLTQAKRLVRVLNHIKALGGVVPELHFIHRAAASRVVDMLKAAPDLERVTLRYWFYRWDSLRNLLNPKTLKQFTLIKFDSLTTLNFLEECKNLTHFNVTDVKCSSWSSLADLQSLEHFGATKAGTIDLSSLANLKNLKSLSIDQCQIQNWNSLKSLSSIEKFCTRCSGFIDVSLLGEMHCLKSLTIDLSPITDWTGLTELSSVEKLEVYGSGFSNTAILENMACLKHLIISHCNVNNWSGLDKLSSLKTIEIYNCPSFEQSKLNRKLEIKTW